jgi:hypothetical protein
MEPVPTGVIHLDPTSILAATDYMDVAAATSTVLLVNAGRRHPHPHPNVIIMIVFHASGKCTRDAITAALLSCAAVYGADKQDVVCMQRADCTRIEKRK